MARKSFEPVYLLYNGTNHFSPLIPMHSSVPQQATQVTAAAAAAAMHAGAGSQCMLSASRQQQQEKLQGTTEQPQQWKHVVTQRQPPATGDQVAEVWQVQERKRPQQSATAPLRQLRCIGRQ